MVPGRVMRSGAATSVVGVVLPARSAAATVRILKVEPGAYRSPAMARFMSGRAESAVRESQVSWAVPESWEARRLGS